MMIEIDLTEEARTLFEKHSLILPIHSIVLANIDMFIELLFLIIKRLKHE